VTLETAFIFVCGSFSIGSPAHPHESKVEIVLAGDKPVKWELPNGDVKEFGTTGFITYGGHTYIRGAACSCRQPHDCDTVTPTYLAKTVLPVIAGEDVQIKSEGATRSDASSRHRKYSANRLVDGNKRTLMLGNVEKNPWWQMRMGSNENGVGKVRIIPRKGSHAAPLFYGTRSVRTRYWHGKTFDGADEGAIVGVSDEECSRQTGCKGTVCGRITKPVANDEYEVDCEGKHGSYLYVQLLGDKRKLLLGEVQVFAAAEEGPVGGELKLANHGRLAWKAGDTLLLTSTSMHAWQTEEVKVAAVKDSDTIEFAGPLAYSHQGCDGPDCEVRADVASLSRNIVIRGGGGCEKAAKPKCGHFMIAHTNFGFVCGAEFTNLGQHTTEGRYPLHIHLPGDAHDLLVKDNALHHNHNRGIVLHGVNHMTAESNVCYKTNGHCFMTEDGSEQFNKIKRNLGVLPKNVDWGCSTHPKARTFKDGCAARSDHDANAFWLPNPNNIVESNIGISSGIAFRIETRHVMGKVRRNFPFEARKVGCKGKLKHCTEMGSFKDNVAHSSRTGFFNYPLLGLTNMKDRGYEGLVAWRNQLGISVHTARRELIIEKARLVENFIAVRAGTSKARPALRNSEIVGQAGNPSSLPFVMKGWSRPLGNCFSATDAYTRNWVRCNGGFSDTRKARCFEKGCVDRRAVNCLKQNFEVLSDPEYFEQCPP